VISVRTSEQEERGEGHLRRALLFERLQTPRRAHRI